MWKRHGYHCFFFFFFFSGPFVLVHPFSCATATKAELTYRCSSETHQRSWTESEDGVLSCLRFAAFVLARPFESGVVGCAHLDLAIFEASTAHPQCHDAD